MRASRRHSDTPGAGRSAPESRFLPSTGQKQSERHFQAQVIFYAYLMRWTVYHTHDSRRSAPGFPDLVLVRRPRVVFAELKREGGKPTVAQQAWLDELAACGQEVHVWRPSDWDLIRAALEHGET